VPHQWVKRSGGRYGPHLVLDNRGRVSRAELLRRLRRARWLVGACYAVAIVWMVVLIVRS
jgi:hypothetical protein